MGNPAAALGIMLKNIGGSVDANALGHGGVKEGGIKSARTSHHSGNVASAASRLLRLFSKRQPA
jgi:hypothetical protein